MFVGRNDELKLGRFLSPIVLISNKKRQFDIQEAALFRLLGFLFILPVDRYPGFASTLQNSHVVNE